MFVDKLEEDRTEQAKQSEQAQVGVQRVLKAGKTLGFKSLMTHPRILLAEDNMEMRQLLASHLRRLDLQVAECKHGMELLDRLTNSWLGLEEEFDLVVSDIRMPGLDGLSVLEGSSTLQTRPPVILITAFGDDKTHATAAAWGAYAVLDKPFEIDQFLNVVQRALGRSF